jgi:malonate transporter
MGPILGITVTLTGHHLPMAVAACFELIGSATSGVAVFAAGLVLGANCVRVSAGVLIGSLDGVSVQSGPVLCSPSSLVRRQSVCSGSSGLLLSPDRRTL